MVLGLLTVTEATLLALELLEEICGFVEREKRGWGEAHFLIFVIDLT